MIDLNTRKYSHYSHYSKGLFFSFSNFGVQKIDNKYHISEKASLRCLLRRLSSALFSRSVYPSFTCSFCGFIIIFQQKFCKNYYWVFVSWWLNHPFIIWTWPADAIWDWRVFHPLKFSVESDKNSYTVDLTTQFSSYIWALFPSVHQVLEQIEKLWIIQRFWNPDK